MGSHEDTSWGKSAEWYDDLLEKGEGTYQKDLILPNLTRLLGDVRGKKILDLACGQGFFARAFAGAGAEVVGTDIAKELIAIARKKSPAFGRLGRPSSPTRSFWRAAGKPSSLLRLQYYAAPADRMPFLKPESFDAIVCVLAIQNIEDMRGALRECARVLKPSGSLYLVLNHPAFRVPQHSDWGYDDVKPPHQTSITETGSHDARSGVGAKGVQYRRVERYLSELKIPIQMHPGANPGERTLTFHRPLQSYAKALASAGFAIARIEEWNSRKKSQPGPHAKAEDIGRKEIPLFMMMEARVM